MSDSFTIDSSYRRWLKYKRGRVTSLDVTARLTEMGNEMGTRG